MTKLFMWSYLVKLSQRTKKRPSKSMGTVISLLLECK
jgi:hypothetical protein